MERTIYVAVVLPLVPVIPIVLSSFAGCPKYAAESSASAIRLSATSITVTSDGTFTGFCATITTAPFPAVSAAKSCPSLTAPLIHTNISPADTFLESYTISETSLSVVPCTHLYSRLVSKLSSFIITIPFLPYIKTSLLIYPAQSPHQILFLLDLSSIQSHYPCYTL